jgi:hypothetical protein
LKEVGAAAPPPDADLAEQTAGALGHAVGSLPGFIGLANVVGGGLKWPEVVRLAAAGNTFARLMLRAAGAGAVGAAAEGLAGGNVKEVAKAGAITAPLGPLGEIGGTPARVASMAGYGAAVPAVEAALDPQRSVLDATPDIIASSVFNALLGYTASGKQNPFGPEFKIDFAEIGPNGGPVRDAKTGRPATRTVTGAEIAEQLHGELVKAGATSSQARQVVERMERLTEQGLVDHAQAEYLDALHRVRATKPVQAEAGKGDVFDRLALTAGGDAARPTAEPPPPAPKPAHSQPVDFGQLVPNLAGLEGQLPAPLAKRVEVVQGLFQRNHPRAADEAQKLDDALAQHRETLTGKQSVAPGQTVDLGGLGRHRVAVEGNLARLTDQLGDHPIEVAPANDAKAVQRLHDKARRQNLAHTFDQLAQAAFLTEDEQTQMGLPRAQQSSAGARYTNYTRTGIKGADEDLKVLARQRAAEALGLAPEEVGLLTKDRAHLLPGTTLRGELALPLAKKLWRRDYDRILTETSLDQEPDFTPLQPWEELIPKKTLTQLRSAAEADWQKKLAAENRAATPPPPRAPDPAKLTSADPAIRIEAKLDALLNQPTAAAPPNPLSEPEPPATVPTTPVPGAPSSPAVAAPAISVEPLSAVGADEQQLVGQRNELQRQLDNTLTGTIRHQRTLEELNAIDTQLRTMQAERQANIPAVEPEPAPPNPPQTSAAGAPLEIRPAVDVERGKAQTVQSSTDERPTQETPARVYGDEAPPRIESRRAAAFVRGSGSPDPSERGLPAEIARQSARLTALAQQTGAVVPTARLAGLKKVADDTNERFVYHDTANHLAVKITHPGKYGIAPTGNGAATPAQYIDRIHNQNAVFGTQTKIEGVILNPSGAPSIVTAEPWEQAADPQNPHPSGSQVVDYMRQEGFQPLNGPGLGWIRTTDGVTVYDTKPDNFILTTDGVVPIDVVVNIPEAVRDTLVDETRSGSPQTAATTPALPDLVTTARQAERLEIVTVGGPESDQRSAVSGQSGTTPAPQPAWQVSRASFVDAVRKGRDFPQLGVNPTPLATLRGANDYGNLDHQAAQHHEAEVTTAFARGAPIPAKVLKDYPALKKTAGQEGETATVGTPVPPPAPAMETGATRLAKVVQDTLASGGKIDNPTLTKLAVEHFGGTRGGGKYDPKDAYDAAETGLNQHLATIAPRLLAEDPVAALQELRALQSQLPRQNVRTDESDSLQQFSTPPTEAFVAAKALDIQPGDVGLESSAGTGSLALWMRAAGATVHVNEIAPRRVESLKAQGYQNVTSLDGEHIHDLLPNNIKPTIAFLNPPFSAGLRVDKNKTAYGARHVEAALQRLETGGRLVAIVGEGMALDKPKFAGWWQKIAKKYTVRANVGVPGEEYGKFGTTFGNQIIVIDNAGPTPGVDWIEQLGHIAWGQEKNLEQVAQRLSRLPPRDRIATTVQRPALAQDSGDLFAGGGGARPAETAGGGELPQFSGRPRPDQPLTSAGTSQSDQGPGTVEARRAGDQPKQQPRPSEAIRRSGGAPEAVRGTAGSPESAIRPDAGVSRSAGLEKPGLESATGEGPDTAATAGVALKSNPARATDEGGSFVSYHPAKLTGGKPHPADIVESASMAAVEPPDITYQPHPVVWQMAKAGQISNVQLEAILYAGQRFQQTLPDGKRAGMSIGAGTGLGKGRIIGGAIRDLWEQGQRKILWLSVGQDLLESAKRDIADVGLGYINVLPVNTWVPDDAINLERGVVFSTYSSLIAKSKKGKTRLQQIMDWLGKDGAIVFDEAHKGKNAFAGDMGEPTQTGQAMIDIQEKLPQAYVMYSSATGATEPRNMAYMTRLGLWGKGTPFNNFVEFMNAMDSVGAMEMVGRDMKALGMYFAPMISYRGVTHEQTEHKLTPDQRKMYDTAAKLWQVVLQNIDEALGITNASAFAASRHKAAFWAGHQRFFRQILAATKIPTLIQKIDAHRQAGMSVVVSLEGTGESRTKEQVNKALGEGRELDTLDFTPREALGALVDSAFPTTVFVDQTDPVTGNVIKVPLLKDGKPVQSKEALALKQKLLDKLSDIDLPDNPLDQIINHFGDKEVAEITGRRKKLKRNSKTGKVEFTKRAPDGVPTDKVNLSEMDNFNTGRKHIAIISRAASTGISLHAWRIFKNQERRAMLFLETGWSADTELQKNGRVHRSDQAHPPHYDYVFTDVGGEKRFVSTIARRLDQLIGLTRGQREAKGGVDLSQYNYESKYGEAALAQFYRAALAGDDIPGVKDPRQALKDMGVLKEDPRTGQQSISKEDLTVVPRFLNRILGLTLDVQNPFFEHFQNTFAQVVTMAKAAGLFDEGVSDVTGESIRLVGQPEVVATDPTTGAKTSHYQLDVDRKTEPLEFADARQIDNGTFYEHEKNGRYIVAQELGTTTDPGTGKLVSRYRIYRPSGSVALMDARDLLAHYNEATAKDAKKTWDAVVAAVPPIKTDRIHIISGALLPVWNRLKRDPEQKLKIVRVKTDDGQRVVGIQVSDKAVGQVLRQLGFAKPLQSADEIWTGVLHGGETVKLQDGLSLRLAKHAGEEAIEVDGVPSTRFDALRELGLQNERIDFKQRFFVPTEDGGGKDVLAKLLAAYPVQDAGNVVRETGPAFGSKPFPAQIADATKEQREAEADRIFQHGISVAEFDAHPAVIEARQYVKDHYPLSLATATTQTLGREWYAAHPATQFNRIVWNVIGLPGAGKSRVIADALVEKYGAFLGDSDPIKKTLDGYADGMGAGLVHDASSHITHAAIDQAIAAGANIVLPTIGADAVKTKENLAKFKKAGYEIHLVEVGVSPDTSRARALARYLGGGQGFIDRTKIAEYGLRPHETFVTLKAENEYSSYHQFDNDAVGQDPETVSTTDRRAIPAVVHRGSATRGRGSRDADRGTTGSGSSASGQVREAGVTTTAAVEPQQIAQYLTSVGVTDPAASDGISRALQSIAAQRVAETDAGHAQGVLDFADAPAPPQRKAQPAQTADRTREAAAIRGEPDALREVIDRHGRVSAIIPALVSRAIPTWDIRGTIIATPADLHAALFAVRSPYFESLKVAVLDNQDVVVHSQIVSVGTLNSALVDPGQLVAVLEAVRTATGKNYNRLVIAHNHPSGDPTPSSEDISITKRVRQAVEGLGFELLDHVITNGEKYVSLKEAGLHDSQSARYGARAPKSFVRQLPPALPASGKAAWEVVPRGSTPSLNTPQEVATWVRILRQNNPTAGHVFYLTTKHRLAGIERIENIATLDRQEIFRRLAAGQAREGAASVVLDVGPLDEVTAVSLVNAAQKQMELLGGNVTDGISLAADGGAYSSLREKGLLRETAAPAVDDGHVRETPPPGQSGTIGNVAKALLRAEDGAVMLPNRADIQGAVKQVKQFEAAAATAMKSWAGRPGDERWEQLKKLAGQPHEFLRGAPGVTGAEIWHLKRLHDATSALAKARILAEWGIEFLKPDVVDVLQQVPYLTDARIAQIGRLILAVPGLAEQAGIPQSRQKILFKTAEAIRGFQPTGEPLLGAMVDPRDLSQGWRYAPEEAEALWNQLNPQERRVVKKWDERRRELATRDGIAVSLEGYLRRYREQNSFQKLLTDLSKERSPLGKMVAGFRKPRQNTPGFMEDFYRAVIGREVESEMEWRHNRFVTDLEAMIARRIEPVKGSLVWYGDKLGDDGQPVTYRVGQVFDDGSLSIRREGDPAILVPPDQAPLVRLVGGQPVREGQLRGGEITVTRRYGPNAGDLVAVDGTTYEYFKEFLADQNPGHRSAFANFLWGKSGSFWRELVGYWKLNQLSGNLGTALTNLAGNSTFYAAMTTYDTAHALATAVTRIHAPEYGKEVRDATRQIIRDLWAPFYALTPGAVAQLPAELYGGKESTLLGDLGVRQDRGGLLGAADEFRGRAGTPQRGIIQRGMDVGGGVAAGAAAGGLAGGDVGALVGGAAGAVFGLRKFLDVGMLPFGVIENIARRATVVARMGARNPNLVQQLVDGTADPETLRQLERAFDSLRTFQIDYTADPPFMKKLGQGAVPFLRWLYGYARQVSNLFPLGKNKDARQRIAGLLTLALLAYLLPAALQWWLERRAQDGEPKLGRGRVDPDAPARFQAKGRQFVGETASGEEVHARTAKYPYWNLQPMLQGAVDDLRAGRLDRLPEEWQTFYKEGVSAGPTLEELAWVFGYKQEFDQFKDAADVQGDILRSFVPFHRLNEYRNKLAQTAADGGTMYVLKPKGFWANFELGLPTELRNVRPSEPDARVINQLTSEFVKLRPDTEALKEWTGINLRFLDPGEYQLWQEDQREKGLKRDSNEAARLKKYIVDQTLAEMGPTDKSRAFFEALYDQTYREDRRQARAEARALEKAIVNGQVPEAAVLKAAGALARQDRELQKEIGLLLQRDLPADQNVDDVKVLLRQRLVTTLRNRALRRVPPPAPARLRERAGGGTAVAESEDSTR